MPIRINCPSCQASLSMPESMYGKAVRCPKCQSPFQCPSGPAPSAPAPAPVRRAKAPVAAVPSSGNPFSFEEASQPPPLGGDVGYEEDRASPRGSGRRLGGWESVLSGFLFLYISAGCFMAWFLLFHFAPKLISSPASLKIVVILDCLLFVAGTVLGVLGQMKCSAIPATSGAKGAATAALVFMVLAAIGSFITMVLILMMLFSSEGGSLFKLLPFFLLTALGALSGAFILFTFFLTISAVFLKQKGLVSSIMAYVVFLAVSPVAYFAFGLTAAMLGGPSPGGGRTGPRGGRGEPEGAGIMSFLPLLYMAVAALWFAFILVQLGGAINRACRRSV